MNIGGVSYSEHIVNRFLASFLEPYLTTCYSNIGFSLHINNQLGMSTLPPLMLRVVEPTITIIFQDQLMVCANRSFNEDLGRENNCFNKSILYLNMCFIYIYIYMGSWIVDCKGHIPILECSKFVDRMMVSLTMSFNANNNTCHGSKYCLHN